MGSRRFVSLLCVDCFPARGEKLRTNRLHARQKYLRRRHSSLSHTCSPPLPHLLPMSWPRTNGAGRDGDGGWQEKALRTCSPPPLHLLSMAWPRTGGAGRYNDGGGQEEALQDRVLVSRTPDPPLPRLLLTSAGGLYSPPPA